MTLHTHQEDCACVEAYLRVNRYLTIAEPPVLDAPRQGPVRTVIDLDIVAIRLATGQGAGPWHTISLDHVIDFPQDHLHAHWDQIGHSQLNDPTLALRAASLGSRVSLGEDRQLGPPSVEVKMPSSVATYQAASAASSCSRCAGNPSSPLPLPNRSRGREDFAVAATPGRRPSGRSHPPKCGAVPRVEVPGIGSFEPGP